MAENPAAEPASYPLPRTGDRAPDCLFAPVSFLSVLHDMPGVER